MAVHYVKFSIQTDCVRKLKSHVCVEWKIMKKFNYESSQRQIHCLSSWFENTQQRQRQAQNWIFVFCFIVCTSINFTRFSLLLFLYYASTHTKSHKLWYLFKELSGKRHGITWSQCSRLSRVKKCFSIAKTSLFFYEVIHRLLLLFWLIYAIFTHKSIIWIER
jgi:hypothetical protein